MMEIKGKNLLVGINDDFFLDVVKKIHRQLRIDYVISSRADRMRAELAGVNILDWRDYMNIDRVSALDISGCFNEQVFAEFNDCFINFLRMVPRLHVFKKDYQPLETYYTKLLFYWLDFVEKNNVSHVVFISTPHMGFDFIIYGIAKQRNIKVSILTRTYILDKFFLVDDIFSRKKVPRHFLAQMTDREITAEIDQDILSSLAAEPESYLAKWNRKNNSRQWITAGSAIINALRFLVRKSWFAQAGISPFAMEKYRGNLYRLYCKMSLDIKYILLRRYYNKISVPYDKLNFKYVYFPLHFQPERSTTPEGGIYYNQYRALEQLRTKLPADIKILVKEHPRQFKGSRTNDRSVRNKQFYNSIIELKGVELVSFAVKSSDLINNSGFVATITGTSGWEALIRGIPAMVFGYPWYRQCESCYMFSELSDINRILSAKPEQVKTDVLKYLVYIQGYLFDSANSEHRAKNCSLSYEQAVNNLVVKWTEFLAE